MNISAPFIRRPIATVLLTCGLALAGVAAFFLLPISPLPQVDFPTISVSASLPGASPETMATSVATPLERRLGIISDVSEMTSSSRVGTTKSRAQLRRSPGAHSKPVERSRRSGSRSRADTSGISTARVRSSNE